MAMETDTWSDVMADLMAARDEPLDPELVPWVETDKTFGKMLRHPLVYMVPLTLPGYANKALAYKRERLAQAIAEEDWHTAVFLHERAYRLKALIDYVIGRDEDDDPIPLVSVPEHWDLAASVWVDSENIEQVMDDWRMLIGYAHGLWLGSEEEREQFEALPLIEHKDGPLIQAWRGGSVGDWSWTTDRKVAEFFARRSGLPVRGHQIPVSDVFGYLTRRGESELLVKFTEFRRKLVYPNG